MNRRLARCILVARQEDRLVTADEALEKRCEALDIFLRPDFDATVGGADVIGKAKLDPWLIGAGVTYRF